MDLINSRPLLIELLTEELPSKNLKKIGFSFGKSLEKSLELSKLKKEECRTEFFITPRRLAVQFSQIFSSSYSKILQEHLVPIEIGLTKTGQYTPFLVRKLERIQKNKNIDIPIKRLFKEKKEYLVIVDSLKKISLHSVLEQLIKNALDSLPISKFMRYQSEIGDNGSIRFIRPLRGLMVLFGKEIIPLQTLGIKAGRETLGHRFMASNPILLDDAKNYERTLAEKGFVIASFEARRKNILQQLKDSAKFFGATIGLDPNLDDLLDEITGLVEYPVVYSGQFDEQFLEVPNECLILSMQSKQKYFPLFNVNNGKLINRFLLVSNIKTVDENNIIQGNQRVLQSRLFDAKFFYDSDLKIKLEDRVEKLRQVTYHNKLGSQYARTERVRTISRYITSCFGIDPEKSDRAAMLSKADLISNMVIEFPELQGIMGAHYAKYHNEPDWLVEALRKQYSTNYKGNLSSKNSIVSVSLFISDRLETLLGIWGLGSTPSGERDPFGLRRAALGLISAFEQLDKYGWLKTNILSSLSINVLLRITFCSFENGLIQPTALREVRNFIYERYRHKLLANFEHKFVDSVISLQPPLHQMATRIQALMDFILLPDAKKIIATNKRIRNLLRKTVGCKYQLDSKLLENHTEKKLAIIVDSLFLRIKNECSLGNFYSSLLLLLELNEPVEAFFREVFVMSPNSHLRINRLALLSQVHDCINCIADLSKVN